MIAQLLRRIGEISSYVVTPGIHDKLHYGKACFYTGWKGRTFKSFDGLIEGRIDIKGARNISVGKGTLIQESAQLYAWEKFQTQTFKPAIVIGENAMIQKYCYLSAINRIEIGDNTSISEHSVIIDNVHGDFRAGHMTFEKNEDIPDVFLQNVKTRHLFSAGPVVIEHDVHIGMYCMIMPGVTIGHNSIVNAHSVVTRNVPPYSIVTGNPAKVVLSFNEAL